MRVDGIYTTISLGINADFDTEATHFQGMVRTDIDNFILDSTYTNDESVSPYLQNFAGEETARVARWGISSNLKMANWIFTNGMICRSKSLNSEANQLKSPTVDNTNGYSVDSLSARQAELFKGNTLIWANGFSEIGNNGLKLVTSDSSAGDTTIGVGGTLTDETASDGRIYYGGYRIPAATTKSWTWDSGEKTATLASTGIGNIPGIYRGMSLVIGSFDDDRNRQNAFQGTNANDAYGLVTIRRITDDSIVFVDVPTELQITQANVSTAIDMRYGLFSRPWITRNTNFQEYWLTAERLIPEGDVGDVDNYKYMLQSQISTATIAFTPGSHPTFVIEGLGTDQRIASARNSGVTYEDPILRRVFSPSKGIGRILFAHEQDPIQTNIVEGSIAFSVSATPFNAVGFAGALDITPGVLAVNMELTMTYTDSSIDTHIENSDLFNVKIPFVNPQGVIILHFPSAQFRPTSENHPRDGKITYAGTASGFVDPIYDTSVLVTTIMGECPIGKNIKV